MIGIVDVEVQAANPQMPLCPFVAFVGSPSSVRVRNVPGNIGSWNITKVYVSANYPDNSIQSRECTRVGEIYVGTLPACNAVGKGANGFVVSADGVDESGNAVTGYVLGKGDLEILDADSAITPGVTTHYVHGLDEQPSDPHEYDIYKDGDTWKIYFDGAWGPLAPAPATLDDTVTRTSANGVKSSGIWSAIWGALSALPTGFSSMYDWCVSQLAGKLNLSGGTMTGPLVCEGGGGIASTPEGTSLVAEAGSRAPFQLIIDAANGVCPAYAKPSDIGIHAFSMTETYALNAKVVYDNAVWNCTTAVLTAGAWNAANWTKLFDLDTGAPASGGTKLITNGQVQSALVGKQNALTEQQLANIAAVPSKANDADVVHKTGAETIAGNKTFADGVAITGDNLKLLNSAYPEYNFSLGTDSNGRIYFVYMREAAVPAIGLAYKSEVDAKADASAIPYTLTTKTISNGAVSLDDRAINAVAVSSSLASLTINFPTATSGKARDFGLRLTVASGITTAPELALPQGVVCENADGEAPEIGADGAATILYFTETAAGVFLVKGEVVTAIS